MWREATYPHTSQWGTGCATFGSRSSDDEIACQNRRQCFRRSMRRAKRTISGSAAWRSAVCRRAGTCPRPCRNTPKRSRMSPTSKGRTVAPVASKILALNQGQ